MPTDNSPPPGVLEASHLSTLVWQKDLLQLFHNAKDRFPDVIWELHPDDGRDLKEEVWGHQAIVYARAPVSFQARYLSVGPLPITSPTSAVLRIIQQTPSAMFTHELEYFYTGNGEVVEFLFNISETRNIVDSEKNRIDKLRKDLVYVWRSHFHSDICISITGTFAMPNPEHITAIFYSHRFILVSRSPYFRAQLLHLGSEAATATGSCAPGEPQRLTLPSPPFTPASLHFTLGYIYSGTLECSHRTYDLDTAFAILRSANYLSLPQLYTEIQARIVCEMLHGLYHAFLEFGEYERITNAKWGTGGCRCRQCARRVPRVLKFAMADDVANNHLERGARRALVSLFGEGWCNSEFAALPQKIRDSIVRGVGKRTTPTNVFPLLFAAQHAMKKLDAIDDAWADETREMVRTAQKKIDECLVTECEVCFEQPQWVEILESDRVGFENAEKVGWVMDALEKGMNERYAPTVYQVLVSSVLLRPHATGSGATMLSQTSPIRAQVEGTRVDLAQRMKKRWIGIRQESGFDALEGWSIKQISQEIEVPLEDLISPTSHHALRNANLSCPLRPSLIRGASNTDPDKISVQSLRTSIMSRATPTSGSHGDPATSGSLIRSIAQRAATLTPSGFPRVHNRNIASARPDSELPLDPASVSRTRTGGTEKTRVRGHVDDRAFTNTAPDV